MKFSDIEQEYKSKCEWCRHAKDRRRRRIVRHIFASFIALLVTGIAFGVLSMLIIDMYKCCKPAFIISCILLAVLYAVIHWLVYNGCSHCYSYDCSWSGYYE